MPNAVSGINRIASQVVPSEVPHLQAADPSDDGDQTIEEPRLRTPEEFFTEVTKRPDIDEILRRLANI